MLPPQISAAEHLLNETCPHCRRIPTLAHPSLPLSASSVISTAPNPTLTQSPSLTSNIGDDSGPGAFTAGRTFYVTNSRLSRRTLARNSGHSQPRDRDPCRGCRSSLKASLRWTCAHLAHFIRTFDLLPLSEINIRLRQHAHWQGFGQSFN